MASIFHRTCWTAHCDFVIKKANQRLFALRALKKCGVPTNDLIRVYCSIVRSVIEYACVVYANLPQCLANALELTQKRALYIIFPGLPYTEALHKSGLPSLRERRNTLCERFIAAIEKGNPLYQLINGRFLDSRFPRSLYNLRCNRSQQIRCKTDRLKNFVTVRYAHFLNRG